MQHDAKGSSPERQAQVEMLLTLMATNKSILSGSFSETGQAGAYFLPATKATRVEGGWQINGTKSYNSNFPAADFVGALCHMVDHLIGQRFDQMKKGECGPIGIDTREMLLMKPPIVPPFCARATGSNPSTWERTD